MLEDEKAVRNPAKVREYLQETESYLARLAITEPLSVVLPSGRRIRYVRCRGFTIESPTLGYLVIEHDLPRERRGLLALPDDDLCSDDFHVGLMLLEDAILACAERILERGSQHDDQLARLSERVSKRARKTFQ